MVWQELSPWLLPPWWPVEVVFFSIFPILAGHLTNKEGE